MIDFQVLANSPLVLLDTKADHKSKVIGRRATCKGGKTGVIVEAGDDDIYAFRCTKCPPMFLDCHLSATDLKLLPVK